eukprot:jgi/Chlat1/2406/Chrsp17S02663
MAAAAAVSMEVGKDGVAVITLRNPPVNALAPHVLRGIDACFKEAHSRQDVKAIVVTGANGKFSGGFDIGAIVATQERGNFDTLSTVSIDLITNTVERGRKPVVAAIEGLALGGGLELAMACHVRLAAPNAQLGLPELQLGIIPGFGGTQRLPRLVGLTKAIEMMLLSKPIKTQDAADLGLVDEVVDSNQLLAAARAAALQIADGRRPRVESLKKTDKLESPEEAKMIVDFARKQARKTAPGLEHPQMCLDAILAGVERGGDVGNQVELEKFRHLVFSDVSKALVHIFFAQRLTSKVVGVTDRGLTPRAIQTVAVLGGGLMGSGICTALALAGIKVILKEVNQKFLDGGMQRIRDNLQSRVKKGKMSKEQYDKVTGLVSGALDYNDFGKADMVIEAVIEDIPLKQKIFEDLEKACKKDCILSTNTSTIDIDIVGFKTKSQDRIVGAHFFSPAHVMPLLEIVRTNTTSPQVILDTIELGKRIKKTPVVVGNCVGFAVNRVFFPYTTTAAFLVDLGVDMYKLDEAIKKFGMPMGPFRLADLVGMEVTLHVGKNAIDAFPERIYKSQMVPMLVEDKRLGERTKKGFYLYDDKRKAQPDRDIEKYVGRSRQMLGLFNGSLSLSEKDIVEMVFFPVVNEGCRVIAEGVVGRAADLDIATVLSMGFPATRGGLIFWADLLSSRYVYDRLTAWEKQYPQHAGIFQPCDYLRERALAGKKLGASDESNARSKL